jgi:hypothetical protein
MQSAAIPSNEFVPVRSLRPLKLLDTAAESRFEAIVNVAVLFCSILISVVGLVDMNRRRISSNKLCGDWSCYAPV